MVSVVGRSLWLVSGKMKGPVVNLSHTARGLDATVLAAAAGLTLCAARRAGPGQLEIGYESRVSLADSRPVVPAVAGIYWASRGTPSQSAAPDLVDTVLSVLTDTGLCPEHLQIAMPATMACHENLDLIAAAGVRTAVHDFDGGATTLIQLTDLPVTEVWLSKPLVRQAKGTGRASLVAGLVDLVHRTGAAVGVGDIQDPTEADWWRRAGADVASGRLYGPA